MRNFYSLQVRSIHVRPIPVLCAFLLLASTLAGCLSSEPESIFIPAVATGDQAEYLIEPRESKIILLVAGPISVLSADLAPKMADVLVVSPGTEDGAPSLYFRAEGLLGLSGQKHGTDRITYHPITSPSPFGVSALFAFHGFAGRTLTVGDAFTISPEWLEGHQGADKCLLTIENLYRGPDGMRANARCQGSAFEALFVFSEGNPFPVKVEIGSQVYRLTAHGLAENVALAVKEHVPFSLTAGPYGLDGPPDGESVPYSLEEATRAVREGLPNRPARLCLEDLPEATLRTASLTIDPDGHQWRLHWSSPIGSCTALVDTRTVEDDLGLHDRASRSGDPGFPPEMPSSVMSLSDGLALWGHIMDHEIELFQIEFDTDGMIQYHFSGGEHSMALDARNLRLITVSMEVAGL